MFESILRMKLNQNFFNSIYQMKFVQVNSLFSKLQFFPRCQRNQPGAVDPPGLGRFFIFCIAATIPKKVKKVKINRTLLVLESEG